MSAEAWVFVSAIRAAGIFAIAWSLPDEWPMSRKIGVVVGVCGIAMASSLQATAGLS